MNERNPRNRRPATSIEGRESKLISMAMDLVEKRISEGTASAQETTHYLKLGSTRERLEQTRLARENELLTAKVENLASAKRIEELYDEALSSMREYKGETIEEDEYYDY